MLVRQALLRGGIPFIIMGGIAFMLYFQEKYSDAKSTFVVSLILFFVGAASVIYDVDHWSLTKQSMIHFCVMLATIFPILLFSGWFEVSSVLDVLKIFLVFLLFGVVLWAFFFTLAKYFSR